MIPATPPGPSLPTSAAELRLRWLRAQPLLLVAYVLIPGFAAALVLTLMIFGLTVAMHGLFGLLFLCGLPLAVFGWTLTRGPEWWLTPLAWPRRAFWLTVLVCFALVPATGYWNPTQWWVWPLVASLCLILPVSSSALARLARRTFGLPLTPDLGETGFVLHFDLNGMSGQVWLELTELRWHLAGTGHQITLPFQQIKQVEVADPNQETRSVRGALSRLDGSDGADLPPGPLLAVTNRQGLVLFPVQHPEAVAEILRRRMAARVQLTHHLAT
ncbi:MULTISPECIES: hypothetical protein [unclassified Crossiella]|uniref:hypothetical protein n=1 Tax=unclassified Crossiella TaxID=2620835 RepID=UPI001FFE4DF3|nr:MULTISPECIES: hypothetical protein [unclassified Crossiella]MCK2240296.1 hypothetical protein [Crossiella sp. S99.2]MCK2253252.1 hypothetical protein [Crossiella sp. S99.1]